MVFKVFFERFFGCQYCLSGFDIFLKYLLYLLMFIIVVFAVFRWVVVFMCMSAFRCLQWLIEDAF